MPTTPTPHTRTSFQLCTWAVEFTECFAPSTSRRPSRTIAYTVPDALWVTGRRAASTICSRTSPGRFPTLDTLRERQSLTRWGTVTAAADRSVSSTTSSLDADGVGVMEYDTFVHSIAQICCSSRLLACQTW